MTETTRRNLVEELRANPPKPDPMQEARRMAEGWGRPIYALQAIVGGTVSSPGLGVITCLNTLAILDSSTGRWK